MNRTIKFRAWDDVSEKMLYPIDIFNEYALFLEDDKNGILHLNRVLDSHGNRKELTLMQFTGLSDKNKREIYEGDIVKIDVTHIANLLHLPELPKYTCGQVVWLCEAFKVCQKHLGATYLGDFSFCNCCPCGLDIIGNIFENPELIK